jgi:serine/threonine-protein kinase
MSPEQERKEDIDGRSDIWSLAIVLYECLTGNRPTVGEYISLTDFNEAIPPAIDDLIRSCLIIEKDARLSSATEFADRLVTALRPTASLARILSSGQLYEIESALTQMG